jgi:hypothetical protein
MGEFLPPRKALPKSSRGFYCDEQKLARLAVLAFSSILA